MRSLIVERKPLPESRRGDFGSMVTITAECNRFLWHMMRRIAGTLVQVGLGKMSEADVAELLAGKGQPIQHSNTSVANGTSSISSKSKRTSGCKQLLAYTAPARGLCLDHVFYEYEREVEGHTYTPR